VTEAEPKERRWFLTVNGAVLEALGSLTAYFAHLEEEVSHLIWSLVAGYDVLGSAPRAGRPGSSLEAQKLGQAITVTLGFRQKLEVLEALAFERFSKQAELLRDFQQIQKDLVSAATERNRLVHSVLVGFNLPDGRAIPGVTMALKGTRDKKLGMAQSVSIHTQEQLSAEADSLARLAWRLHELRKRSFPPDEASE
jgi:hypothetical protein